MVEDQVSGYDRGADDYLTKPFDSKMLLARVIPSAAPEEVNRKASPTAGSPRASPTRGSRPQAVGKLSILL